MKEIKTIYVDLDGVLVNFAAKAASVTGIDPHIALVDKQVRNVFWKAINTHIVNGHQFFSAMEMMDDGLELWNYVNSICSDVQICSATGNVKNARAEKLEWIRANLGEGAAACANIVSQGPDKALFASPHAILIDDREKVLRPFIDAGGEGVLHVSAVDTIMKLKGYRYVN